jgi:hypothetical protein
MKINLLLDDWLHWKIINNLFFRRQRGSYKVVESSECNMITSRKIQIYQARIFGSNS